MNVGELKTRLSMVDDELTVKVVLSCPGSIGAQPTIDVKSAYGGFDWDAGKLLLYPTEKIALFELTQEDRIKELQSKMGWIEYEKSDLKKQIKDLRKQVKHLTAKVLENDAARSVILEHLDEDTLLTVFTQGKKSSEYMKQKYQEVSKRGRLIDQSSGQFTGGCYTEVWESYLEIYKFTMSSEDEIYELRVYSRDFTRKS